MSKCQKFLNHAQPDENGRTPKIAIKDLPEDLHFGNGASWARSGSTLAKKYIVELFKEGRGNKNTHIQLLGYNNDSRTQAISPRIRRALKGDTCRYCGKSTQPEVDHKDGRKDDERVMNTKTQRVEDFQILCKGCNDQKRQVCKVCKRSSLRYDATNLGYPKSVMSGKIEYEGTCKGCLWYDPVEFRKGLAVIN